MTEARYDIYYCGDLLDGFYQDFVKADMAALFKADPNKLNAFFSGKPQPVKLNVDKLTAAKYQAALENIGARPIVVPTGEAPATRDPKSAVSSDKTTTAREENDAANAHDIATESGIVAGSKPDEAGKWGIMPAGSDIGERRNESPVEVDTSQLSIAQVGADLIEHPSRPEPVQVDISGLTLDEPGVILIEPDRSPPPKAPDISHLALE